MDGDLGGLLEKSDAVVGAASRTCAHGIDSGVPVVVPGEPGGLIQNPIPAFADPSLWTACYTADDLAATLGRYAEANRDEVERRRDMGRRFRERVFEPVTRESVRRVLGLENSVLERIA